MHFAKLSSANEAQRNICRLLLESGTEVDPRGLPTREALGVSFELVDPRRRITTVRKWNPALAVAELAWNLRSERSVDALAFYAPRWRDFSDADGMVRGSCYGAKIFSSELGESTQWESVKRVLEHDPHTRRAVLNFRTEESVAQETNDLSCINTVQFLNRSGELHAFVSMRSNDAIWGVPYDLFLFTSLQELMASELGLRLGSYHHYAASMHVYERHLDVASRVASRCDADDSPMSAISSSEEMRRIADIEREVRDGGDVATLGPFTPYQLQCLSLLGLDVPARLAA